MPDSVRLCDIFPPPSNSLYKSYADIDRVPSRYLGELASPSPRYYHPDCGSFHTFGWCSEREMAFVALMSLYGYIGKVYQRSIHVISSFRVEFTDTSGITRIMIADVDNTFNHISWNESTHSDRGAWQNDIGRGTTIQWYNEQALSERQRDQIKSIRMTAQSIQRIDRLVKEYLQTR
jgi:hypothetical protein